MPTREDVDHQQELLRIHRRNLNHFLSQHALQGGMTFTNPAVTNGIREARKNILHIKKTLSAWGEEFENYPDDGEEVPIPPRPVPSSPVPQGTSTIREHANTATRKLKIFLCYAPDDTNAVRNIYQRLPHDGFQPWMEDEDLVPGQKSDYVIPQEIRKSDAFLVCLTKQSSSPGRFHQNLKRAIDVAEEQPEGTIFLIPGILEPCEVPYQLSEYGEVRLYEPDGYERLVKALRVREKNLRD